MGSGFNFFTNGIDKTPTTTGAWVDVDVSGDGVPSGATGVIVKIVNTGAAAGRGEVRKNGSTDNFGLNVAIDHGRYAFVGIDANRIFEAYIGATTMKIYLIGYTDDNVGFFDNGIDKTPASSGSWIDIDVSGNIPSGSTGVICVLYNGDAATNYDGGIRKNGSSDTFTLGEIQLTKRYGYQLCGVDANRIFEAQVENTVVKVILVGYTKSPITFFDNGIDKSLGAAGSWTDIDVTAETAADADGAILFMKNTHATVDCVGDVRKNGSTDNHTVDMAIRKTGCVGAAIGMDAEQIFEGYVSNVAVDFYLIGYCKPSATSINVSDSGTGTDSLAALEASMAILESGSGIDVPQMEASLSLSDSGVGMDTATAGVPVDVTDSGVGSDMITQLQASLPIVDSGVGSDAIADLQTQLTVLESGLGSDVWTVEGAGVWVGLFGQLEIIHPEAEIEILFPSGSLEVKHPTGEMEIVKK